MGAHPAEERGLGRARFHWAVAVTGFAHHCAQGRSGRFAEGESVGSPRFEEIYGIPRCFVRSLEE